MLGAIIGDVAGSSYEVLEIKSLKNNKKARSYEERIKILDKNVPLFNSDSCCTDDSILTYAIYDAIVNGNCEYEKYIKEYGLNEIALGKDKYNRGRFGKRFVEWLQGNYQGDSYGNGAAMRISPVGYLFNSLDEVKRNAYLATIPSHNDEEAIKGAEAVAVAIYLLRCGYDKDEVVKYIKSNYYDLNFNLEELQKKYTFSSRTKNSVPQAFYVFSESVNFEDSIRKAISIGGDTDTIACIVGSLAEAYYGIPSRLKEEVKPYLKDYMIPLFKDIYFENNDIKLELKKDER